MSIPLRHDFIQFAAALDTVVEKWQPLSEEEAKAKVMTPYQLMAEKVIDSVADTTPGLHPKLTNDHARHGALVLARYCNVAALVAHREDYDKTRLTAMLGSESSFGTVARIASSQDDIAIMVENQLGLRGYYTEPELVSFKLRNWTVDTSGGLSVPDIDQILYESAAKVAHKGRLDLSKKRECTAHSNHMLGKIYRSFIDICSRDPLLFDRTLADSHSTAI